jgi:type I restriction enzyme S subunit
MSPMQMKQKILKDLCSYRNETVDASLAQITSYISTENMLPNRQGVAVASSTPSTGRVQIYRRNDVLISNIRPYFKKIWLADKDGCCSNDVLVLTATNCDSNYLYFLLSSDAFFGYVNSTSKGTKMPRGDKKAILDWQSLVHDESEQKSIAAILSPLEKKIKVNKKINDNLSQSENSLFNTKIN